MQKLLGDNVFVLTLGAVIVPALAVLGIILNILIRDGPDVGQEIQFLEFIGGVTTLLHGLFAVVHAFLAKKLPPSA